MSVPIQTLTPAFMTVASAFEHPSDQPLPAGVWSETSANGVVLSKPSNLRCSKLLCRCRGFRWGFLPIAFVKAIHASCRIDQLLFAGEKRMACRTDFNMQVALFGGMCLKRFAAGARHRDLVILGVNSWFHYP
jgi:hypothetical protein